MSTRRMMGISGVLVIVSALAIALPGCGGEPAATGPAGEPKLAPVVNPAPGAAQPETTQTTPPK